MSKYSLIFIATSVLLVLAVLFVLFALTPPGWPTGGEVDVTVTPEVLIAGQPPRFKLEFNTHPVELDFDIEKSPASPMTGEKIMANRPGKVLLPAVTTARAPSLSRSFSVTSNQLH